MKTIAIAACLLSTMLTPARVQEAPGEATTARTSGSLNENHLLLARATAIDPTMRGYVEARVEAEEEGLISDDQRSMAEYGVARDIAKNREQDLVAADARDLRSLVGAHRTFIAVAHDQDARGCDAYVSGRESGRIEPTPALFAADRALTVRTIDMLVTLHAAVRAGDRNARIAARGAAHMLDAHSTTSAAAARIDAAMNAAGGDGVCLEAMAYDDAVLHAPEADFDRMIGEWLQRA